MRDTVDGINEAAFERAMLGTTKRKPRKAKMVTRCAHLNSKRGTTANVCQDCGAVWMPRA